MASRNLLQALFATGLLTSCSQPERAEESVGPPAPKIIMEGYPDEIATSLAQHEVELKAASEKLSMGISAIIRKRQHRWLPGSTVTVAFYGGNDGLLAQIEQAAQQWTAPGRANLRLSFRDDQGKFRRWTPRDQTYAGDIRVGFNGGAYGAYWSLVGTDSHDKTIKGGAANQQSMNFQAFDKGLPKDWQITVLHEFGHALGFEHEHQSPAAQCGFRFDDDPGYVRTVDQEGWFTTDEQNRRPGLYTYLGGKDNYWPPQKVDQNLRQLAASEAYEVGTYDKLSIMEYVFDAFMFAAGDKSPCYVPRDNAQLSAQDIAALKRAYPAGQQKSALETAIESETRALANVAGASSTFKASMANRVAYQRETSH